MSDNPYDSSNLVPLGETLNSVDTSGKGLSDTKYVAPIGLSLN